MLPWMVSVVLLLLRADAVLMDGYWWFCLTVFWMVNMVSLLQGADAILGDGYGSQGQRYVALIQGSEMSAGFTTRV